MTKRPTRGHGMHAQYSTVCTFPVLYYYLALVEMLLSLIPRSWGKLRTRGLGLLYVIRVKIGRIFGEQSNLGARSGAVEYV